MFQLNKGVLYPVFFALITLSFFNSSKAQINTDLATSTLNINNNNINVEIANTELKREIGLMNRKQMPDDQGMIFVFPKTDNLCFWMKNTKIPLTVAFITDKGVIVDLEKMAPETLDTHCSSQPVAYALEMNINWFDQKGIKPNDIVKGLPPQSMAQ